MDRSEVIEDGKEALAAARSTTPMWMTTGKNWITQEMISSRLSDGARRVSIPCKFIGYMRDVGTPEDPCYVPCAKGDEGYFEVFGVPKPQPRL